ATDSIMSEVGRNLIKNFFEVTSNSYHLELYIPSEVVTTPRISRIHHDFHQLIKGLNRLSSNTTVSRIHLGITANEHNCRIIEELSNFMTSELFVYQMNLQFFPPLFNLSILRNFTQNVRNISIKRASTFITAQDLCTLRKIMLEGECKLMWFSVVPTSLL
ncbi:hypothetical protein PENTCL1PPCAC_21131, partial [Pristionchus entomophagus]